MWLDVPVADTVNREWLKRGCQALIVPVRLEQQARSPGQGLVSGEETCIRLQRKRWIIRGDAKQFA